MEMDEQKKRERAPKQNTQETSMVASDMALPEQNKIRNEHKDTPKELIKALFPVSTEPVSFNKRTTMNSSNTVSSITTTQVSTKDDAAPLQDSANLGDQGTIKANNTSSKTEGATYLGKEMAS